MAPGTTISIDASFCDPTGGFSGIGALQTSPQHGTATASNTPNWATVTYTNNGDGATTDTFTFLDANSSPVRVTVLIAPLSSPITVTPVSAPGLHVGVAYTLALSASGGTAPYTYTLAAGSSLPPGINFNSSTATFSGTPTAWGAYNANITVQDSAGHSTTKGYDLTVPQPTITGGPLAQPFLNVAYSQTVTITGGTSPWHNFAVQGGEGACLRA